jgi:hypothetical protein
MKRLVWFVVVLGLVGAAFFAGGRFATRDTVVATSPDGAQIAWASERRCMNGPCEALWLGSSRSSAVKVSTLDGASRTREIAWTKDGSRVAFLIDGTELQFFSPSSRMPAGRMTLVASPNGPTASIVRGITFSDNGRAVTFDECPRSHSGCRAGFAAVPQ